MTSKQIVAWAGGLVAGLGAIVWIYGIFLTKNEHETYVTSHKEWSQEVLSVIRNDMASLRIDTKELKEGHNAILRKLDGIELRLMTGRYKEGAYNFRTNYNDFMGVPKFPANPYE